MNENFIESLNKIKEISTTRTIISDITKSIKFLNENEFNELNKICNTLDRELPFLDYDEKKTYIYASIDTFKKAKIFRYNVFVKSKTDINYRYFLRLCFNYFYRFRDEKKHSRLLEKIFNHYDHTHEGYKEMKQKMLQYKLEDREEEFYDYEF